MKVFLNPEMEQKYQRLGFSPADLSLKVSIGNVSVYAVEHPFKGVMLTFESFTSRSMCQYQVTLPAKCSVEQIAGLIYLNIAHNFRDSKDAFKVHFEKLGIALFQ